MGLDFTAKPLLLPSPQQSLPPHAHYMAMGPDESLSPPASLSASTMAPPGTTVHPHIHICPLKAWVTICSQKLSRTTHHQPAPPNLAPASPYKNSMAFLVTQKGSL